MKKRLFALLFVLSVLMGVMAFSANAAATTQTATCPCCGTENTVWYSLNEVGIDAGYSHYYLSDHLSLTEQIILENKTICLDLNGYKLTGHHRAFLLRGTTTLSITDTSETKSGQVIGTFVGASQSGGTISVGAGCELNIYDGAFSYDATDGKAQYGGVLYTEGGTINIYDGKIIGGACKSNGGAIALRYATSQLNIYGGEITSGAADGNGDCISAFRNADGTVRVGGDAKIDEIWYGQGPTADTFQIIEADDVPAFVGNVVVNGNKVTMYDTLAKAIENAGSGYVILSADVETLNISKDITIDLNGKDITNLNVAAGATVKVRDRKTEDHDCSDGDYGIIKNISGNVVADDSHVAVTAAEGTSCHYYSMALTSVTLRPSSNGIYYKSEFLGDSMVAQQVATFGVALNISQEPNATNMKPGAYSAFTAEDFGGENNSTVLVNIMKTANSAATNATNAQKKVYGRAYMKLTDGSYLFSDTVYYSLQELTEIISKDYWTELTDIQKNDLIQMYGRFQDTMADWDIDNIVNGYNESVKDETQTLKVLLVGNSHSLDTFHLLYDVIEAEGIPQNNPYGAKSVELGVLYYGGCRMSKHAEHAKGDVAAYDYYRVGPSTNGEWVKTPSTTMKTGLQAEKWDIVVLQEMSMEQGIFEAGYTSNATTSTQYVCNYIKRTLGYTPEFRWNQVWSNPTIPDCCDEENYTTDAQYKTKWIYKLQTPAYGGYLDGYYSWENRAMSFYGNDPQQQHILMTEYLQDHIIGKYGIKTADQVVNPGTTMMYALNKLTLDGSSYDRLTNEKFAYRDYTHLSDVSRVMVSYLWYAELFGLDSIDSIKYTTIPAAMRAKDQSADVVLTKAMQNNMIEAVNYTLENPFGQYMEHVPMNILLIGNSSCYYWTDELWGMLDAAGYKNVNVYNLYSDGASLQNHYTWMTEGTSTCQLICVNKNGRTTTKNMNITSALDVCQWDYVSILQTSKYYLGLGQYAVDPMDSITPYLGELLALIKEKAPNAQLYWQAGWAYELGHVRSYFTMDTEEKRTAMANRYKEAGQAVSEQYGLPVIPLYDAWENVRDQFIVDADVDVNVTVDASNNTEAKKQFTLCTRIKSGTLYDDLSHDGDVGGGQYLNACVVYEMFTGLDCRENTFRPKYTYNAMDYSLTEEEIGLLQNAAHNSVQTNS